MARIWIGCTSCNKNIRLAYPEKSPLERGGAQRRGVFMVCGITMKPPRAILSYNPALKKLARELRNQSILSEVLLWQQRKGGQRLGHDFHRQRPIDEYIVDFFAADLQLAVEIDGESHALNGSRDEKRQKRLESLGLRFLRFEDAAVKSDLDAVVRAIDGWIADNEIER